jgi:hypothetical protein
MRELDALDGIRTLAQVDMLRPIYELSCLQSV